MDSKVLFVLLLATIAHAGVIPSQKILQGPSTKTRVVGPDGSVIDAYLPGGKIVLDDNAGPVVQAAPVVLALAAIEQPQEAVAQPVVEARNLSEGQAIAAAVPETPVVAVTPVTLGSSVAPGTLLESKNFVDEPSVKVVDVQPDAEEAAPTTEGNNESGTEESSTDSEADETTSKSDAEGQYVPDNIEKLFDDGSYRPEHH